MHAYPPFHCIKPSGKSTTLNTRVMQLVSHTISRHRLLLSLRGGRGEGEGRERERR